jgi:hypothetical protein
MKRKKRQMEIAAAKQSFNELAALQSQQSLSKKKGDDDLLQEGIVEEDVGIDNYYSPNLPSRVKELLSSYYMLLGSLELNQIMYEKQQKVLDDLVDLCAEKT